MILIRRLRLFLIALINFLFIINWGFLQRTIAFILCGILSFNSVTCSSFLNEYGAKATAATQSNTVEPLKEKVTTQQDKQKIAGCFLGICVNNIPQIPPMPGGGNPTDIDRPAQALIPARTNDGKPEPTILPEPGDLLLYTSVDKLQVTTFVACCSSKS